MSFGTFVFLLVCPSEQPSSADQVVYHKAFVRRVVFMLMLIRVPCFGPFLPFLWWIQIQRNQDEYIQTHVACMSTATWSTCTRSLLFIMFNFYIVINHLSSWSLVYSSLSFQCTKQPRHSPQVWTLLIPQTDAAAFRGWMSCDLCYI